jgi:hypothetical protein
MRLTASFSRVHSGTLFPSGVQDPDPVPPGTGNLTGQKKGPPDLSKYKTHYGGPSPEHQIWRENNMPSVVPYKGDRYSWTGKIGYDDKDDNVWFEYSYEGHQGEARIWVNPDRKIVED